MTLKTIVTDIVSIPYERRLLIFDTGGFASVFDYIAMLTEACYRVVAYDDVETIRLLYENDLRSSDGNWAIIVQNDSYVPYDLRQACYEIQLSLHTVFPKLDAPTLKKHVTDLDIIGLAYGDVYGDKLSPEETEQFISETALSAANIRRYVASRRLVLVEWIASRCGKPLNYSEWLDVAQEKASLEVYAARAGMAVDWSFADDAFVEFVMSDYSKLSGQTSSAAPAILAKTWDHIAKGRVALIVMDGMSLFDFNVLSRYFDGIEYDLHCAYALIPSTTAISRQTLLSGKYPRQRESPFSLSKEKRDFYDAAAEHGYTKQQAAYVRGYDFHLSPFTKLVAVIINDVDDIVHGQQQGRQGMFNDITLLARTGRLQVLIRSLHTAGFTVYLTADHGNTLCKGIGTRRNAGVEVETKAKRMVVLKDFAEIADDIIEHTVEYPGYYLDQNYKYLICKPGVSFDDKDSEVMTHGGITLDEVIVPFVKIKAVNPWQE